MRNNFLSILCLAALSLGFVSCDPEKPGTEPNELKTPVLKIDAQDESSFTVSWTAVENAGGYTYIFQNGEETETQALSLSFTDLTTDVEYTIKVKATANSEELQDSKYAEIKVTLKKADEPEKVTLKLEVSEITTESAKITVSPSNDNAFYFVHTTDNEFISIYGTLEEFVRKTIDMYMNELGTSFDALTESGKIEKTFDGLESNADHTAFAVCLNEDGSFASEIFSVEYRTEAKPVYDLTLELTVSDITANSARISVSPSDKEATFYYDCIKAVYLEEYDSIEDYLLTQFAFNDKFGGTHLDKGDCSFNFTGLYGDTEYLAIAIGVNKDENKNYTFTSAPVTSKFKTDAAETKE